MSRRTSTDELITGFAATISARPGRWRAGAPLEVEIAAGGDGVGGDDVGFRGVFELSRQLAGEPLVVVVEEREPLALRLKGALVARCRRRAAVRLDAHIAHRRR